MRTALCVPHRQAAMTLLEVMVVVAIIGMIAGLVAVIAIDRLQDAKVTLAKAQISTFVDALQLFNLDNGFYPSTEQGLRALVTQPASGRIPQKWPPNGYLEVVPRDPWGNEYQYISPAPEGDFLIVSFGRDGLQGGEGYDADITHHDIVDSATKP